MTEQAGERRIYAWDGGFRALEQYDGQKVTILRPAIVPDEADEEVGPMFLARFPDGTENFVFADEVQAICFCEIGYECLDCARRRIARREADNDLRGGRT